MCDNAVQSECKLYVQTISDLVEKLQDVIFSVQALEAPASGFILLSAISLQNALQSLAAAADHLQHAANGNDLP